MPFSKTLYYHKQILRKVSFDAELFFKELEKAYDRLSYDESLLLNHWLVCFYKDNPQLAVNSSQF